MIRSRQITFFLLVLSLLLMSQTNGLANDLSKTKLQLTQLTKQIRHTENKLTKDKQKRHALNGQLAVQEKKMSQLINQKNQLDSQLKRNGQEIVSLNKQIKILDEQITLDQQALIQHTRSRYMVDAHQPVKWLLSPGSKDELSQILTYYQYIINAQRDSIHTITQKTNDLKSKQITLSKRMQDDKSLRQNLSKKQAEFVSAQQKQKRIIQALDRSISDQAQKLKEFKDNQQGLSRVLARLNKQDRFEQSKPFASRRHHLPRPVLVSTKSIKSIHQGLAFFAEEGATVKAIHPGKILFSDWLKGYGLLLIIDHGNGYLTLYAHNQALTKKKGDWVDGGEKIAEVGHSGGLRENGLYFEIRHNGKAISPINWLS